MHKPIFVKFMEKKKYIRLFLYGFLVGVAILYGVYEFKKDPMAYEHTYTLLTSPTGYAHYPDEDNKNYIELLLLSPSDPLPSFVLNTKKEQKDISLQQWVQEIKSGLDKLDVYAISSYNASEAGYDFSIDQVINISYEVNNPNTGDSLLLTLKPVDPTQGTQSSLYRDNKKQITHKYFSMVILASPKQS